MSILKHFQFIDLATKMICILNISLAISCTPVLQLPPDFELPLSNAEEENMGLRSRHCSLATDSALSKSKACPVSGGSFTTNPDLVMRVRNPLQCI